MKNKLGLVLVGCLLGVSTVWGADAHNGEKLFKSASLGGSKNDQSCNTCHANGAGFKEGLFSRKEHTLMGMKFESVADIVNMCIEKPLEGKAIAQKSKEMEDILAYMKTITK